MDKKVCVVVPVHNRLEKTKRFLKSFENVRYKNYTIVIVDDGSTDGTSDYLKQNHPEVVILYGDGNYWWSGATNLGVKYALENGFNYVLTINNDSEILPNSLTYLVETAEKNVDTIVAARTMYPDKVKIWSIGVLVNFRTHPFLHLQFCNENFNDSFQKNYEVEALAGNGVLVPIKVFNKIGLYNEKWCPQYHGDTEFTYRATRANFKCIVNTEAVVVNNEFDADPKHSFYNTIMSKRSGFYWRPTFYFYAKYVPWKYKIYYFKQLLWIPKRLVKLIKYRLKLV